MGLHSFTDWKFIRLKFQGLKYWSDYRDLGYTGGYSIEDNMPFYIVQNITDQ